jgi:outer membrane protein assembly factor BamE
MHLSAKILLCTIMVISAPGCSNLSMPKVPNFDHSFLRLPEVHKVDIQQGNIITQEMIDELKPGMSKSQVRFVMGTPLIADTFKQNRWDYFYSLKPGKGLEVRERMAVFFEDEKLSGLKGDYMPSPEPEEQVAPAEPEEQVAPAEPEEQVQLEK